ncbi:hypothetical protein CRE_28803 [Caenorhabditis remanei]|uniref:Uncharacterized protein n=1 Tax=Caenorhabditis remanei TaxID=31234 RepID=E3MK63_CAERE|nr:hypothetical protein CRE_28803 [Caenorhabditis remanei]
MSLNAIDLEALHTPETRNEDFENLKQREYGFSFLYIFITFVAIQFASLFLILGLSDYKTCSADSRVRIWMMLVGALLLLERGIAIRRQIARTNFHNYKFQSLENEDWKHEMQRKKLKSRPVSQDFIWLLLVVL